MPGDFAEVRTEILQGEAVVEGTRARNRKYAPWKQLLDNTVITHKQTERSAGPPRRCRRPSGKLQGDYHRSNHELDEWTQTG